MPRPPTPEAPWRDDATWRALAQFVTTAGQAPHLSVRDPYRIIDRARHTRRLRPLLSNDRKALIRMRERGSAFEPRKAPAWALVCLAQLGAIDEATLLAPGVHQPLDDDPDGPLVAARRLTPAAAHSALDELYEACLTAKRRRGAHSGVKPSGARRRVRAGWTEAQVEAFVQTHRKLHEPQAALQWRERGAEVTATLRRWLGDGHHDRLLARILPDVAPVLYVLEDFELRAALSERTAEAAAAGTVDGISGLFARLEGRGTNGATWQTEVDESVLAGEPEALIRATGRRVTDPGHARAAGAAYVVEARIRGALAAQRDAL